MISRTPGEGRYARLEREQRWLAGGLPEGAVDPVRIHDRYLDGTRLRLRRVQRADEVVLKLAQKVRPDPADPGLVKLTSLYLSPSEYDALAVLPAAELTKTRWRWPVGTRLLAVDQFAGALEGLFLLEAELDAAGPRQRPPGPGLVEVTDDDRYSGGRLARATEADIRSLLSGPG